MEPSAPGDTHPLPARPPQPPSGGFLFGGWQPGTVLMHDAIKGRQRRGTRSMFNLSEALTSAHAGHKFSAVRVAPVSELGGIQPKAGACHENAMAHAASHADCSVVEGWLLLQGGLNFLKHSVVEMPKGKLFCVTLAGVQGTISFIAHTNAWGDFASLPDIVPKMISQQEFDGLSSYVPETLGYRR